MENLIANFEKRYERLNAAQKKAVDTIEGPVMVVAGPGSGKTELLSMRVANILRTSDVNPSNILCLTFTDNAAVNMRRRLEALIGADAYRVAIHTFHSFGTMIIERYPEHFFGAASFSAIDELFQYEILNDIFAQLPDSNPLRSYHPEKGFVYLSATKSAISDLKRTGLSPDEFRAILDENEYFINNSTDQINELAARRISKLSLEEWLKFHDWLQNQADKISQKKDRDQFYRPLPEVLALSLEKSLKDAAEMDKTAPLTEWKKQHIKKEDENYVLKAAAQSEKLQALAEVYQSYLDTLYNEGYFDYDDMLLQVVQRLRNSPELLYEVTEQYRYIHVDEFQDTNDAQMKLLLALSRRDITDGRPNVMVVGDDDQAIYRFQGAEISNILDFRRFFKDPEIIVLTKNYRSIPDIVDLSRQTILQGENRLENRLPDIEKALEAANTDLGPGDVRYQLLPTEAHEYTYVAQEIKRLIKDEGLEPADIAVIGRDHKHLEALVAHLHHHDVPLRYERQLDVLKQSHIRQLTTMTRYINSLAGSADDANELLPEILSYPFWGIDRIEIWKLSRQAWQNHENWLEAMLTSNNQTLRHMAEFFSALALKSQHEPMEIILDYLIGSHVPILYEEDEDNAAGDLPELVENFRSPFREFYFGKNVLEENRPQYLGFLSNLRVFVQALREYKKGKQVKLADLNIFLDTHETYNQLVADVSPFVSAANSVHVMTAHKAKGLEFDTVFVINCVDEVWGKSRSFGLLTFPENLPIQPGSDDNDDRLRLFFVAMTRAARLLYLTGYALTDKGTEVPRLRFLAGLEAAEKSVKVPEATDVLRASLSSYHDLPPSPSEETLLREMAAEYTMPVTHLNTFLNVATAGPQAFFENSFLHFPQAKSPSAAFGTAMHATVEQMYRILKLEGELPAVERLKTIFLTNLEKQRLSTVDFGRLSTRGTEALAFYLEQKRDDFQKEARLEVDFRHQGVVIEGIPLTGKIDKIEFQGNRELKVCDFKTGKCFRDWQTKNDSDKVKLHNYRRQLAFYRLLIENSNEFRSYKVIESALEFLEPEDEEIIDLVAHVTDDEVDRLKNLIAAVGVLIKKLEFPPIDDYPKTYKGIIEFEEFLLENYDK